MATEQVRDIVNDVDGAVAFSCRHRGFSERMPPSPMSAILARGDLRLVRSQPGGPHLGRWRDARGWSEAGAWRLESLCWRGR